MGISRQEYWNGLSRPSPGDLPDPGIEPTSLIAPALAGGLFTNSTPGNPKEEVSKAKYQKGMSLGNKDTFHEYYPKSYRR